MFISYKLVTVFIVVTSFLMISYHDTKQIYLSLVTLIPSPTAMIVEINLSSVMI